MKNSILKTVLTCCICVLFICAVNAHGHHRGGGSKDLYRAAAIVDIVANSLVGLSILSGNTSAVVPAAVVPAPVVVPTPAPVVVPTPAPIYTAPYPVYRPVYVAPPRIYRRPPPPPPRHHGGHHGRHHGKRR